MEDTLKVNVRIGRRDGEAEARETVRLIKEATLFGPRPVQVTTTYHFGSWHIWVAAEFGVADGVTYATDDRLIAEKALLVEVCDALALAALRNKS